MELDRQMEGKILTRAAELVERGWCQGYLGVERIKGGYGAYRGSLLVPTNIEGLDRAEQVCAMGAISLALTEVTGLTPNVDEARLTLDSEYDAARTQVVRRVRPPEGQYLAEWNDQPGRTQAEVAALLRKAAE